MASKKILFIEYCAKDFLDGTFQMEPLEELAYRRICDMIYTTEDNLLDNDRVMSHATKTGSKWKDIKQSLIEFHKKIFIEDGKIRNAICTKKLEKIHAKLGQCSAAGKLSSKKRNSLKNKQTMSTDVKVSLDENEKKSSTNQEPRTKNHVSNKLDTDSDQKNEIEFAFDLYNQTAKKIGIPPVQKATKTRMAKIRARLKEAGGIDGWKHALSKIEGSAFCRGEINGFKATLDFMLQESSFVKLLEGNYDDNKHAKKESRNDIIDRQTRECLAEGSFDLGIYQPVLEDLSEF